VSLAPFSIEVNQVKSLVDQGYVSKKQLCTGKFAGLCKEHGIK
jgi:D-xylose transport system substrate-binding protein